MEIGSPTIDFVALAQTQPLAEFVARHPFAFLVGEPKIDVPTAPGKTMLGMRALQRIDTQAVNDAAVAQAAAQLPKRAFAVPLRKVQHAFPSMITVGRTANNDVVVGDSTVSRFHAYFREVDGAFELVDAGSRNGTKLRSLPLKPKEPVPVKLGDRITFGNIALSLLDARGCWELVRGHRPG